MGPMSVVVLEDVRTHLSRAGRGIGPVEVAGALRNLGYLVTDTSVRDTVAALRRESAGAGPLEPLLAQPGVTDVVVNGSTRVYVDRGAGLEQVESPFTDEAQVRRAGRVEPDAELADLKPQSLLWSDDSVEDR